MKKAKQQLCSFILILLVLSASTFLQAQRLRYVDNTNTNPSPDGSTISPWRTLAEVSAGAISGDIVYFKRGQSFYGTLDVLSNNIQFDAWGTGPNPKITGFSKIESAAFTSNDGNIYKYPFSTTTRPRVVKMDGAMLEIGREPNSNAANGGYYTYVNTGSDPILGNYITAGSISELLNTKEVVIRTNNYSIETKPVSQLDHTGGRIYYGVTHGFNGADYSFPPQNNYGYYFQDAMATLDRDGEWFFDEDNNEFCFYFSSAPTAIIYVSTVDILCNLNKFSNISIKNIDFEGAGTMAIDMGNNSDVLENTNITVQYCNFTNIGIRAVHARHTLGLYVADCSFSHCLSGAVQFLTHYYSGWQPINKIENCTFTDIAPYPGMAYNTDAGDNNAINMFTAYVSDISGNTFDGIGKAAIYWQGDDVIIGANKISNAMKNFADYGAIYTYDDGSYGRFENRVISNNLIHDCPGNIFGTLLQEPIANGIYLDGNTADVIVRGNTVYNMGSSGIMSNCPRNILLQNNTLYNNVNGIRYTHRMDYLPNDDIEIRIYNNKIYSERGQENATLLPAFNRLTAAISFVTSNPNWTDDLRNTDCQDNAYSFTNPIPFNIEVPVSANQPSNWVGFDTWKALASEQGTKTFPARENFMPNGQAYVIDGNATPFPYRNPDPTYAGWAAINSTATTTVTGGELKVVFTPTPNAWAVITHSFATSLQLGKWYIFSYAIRTESGTGGVCRSYVRNGTISTAPTWDNYRTYTAAGTMVNYLIYVPATMTNPVFCIEIDKISGTTYISNIKIDDYQAADIQVDDATDFVQLAYNPYWYQPENYSLTLNLQNGWGAVDGAGYITYDDVDFDYSFQSIILFTDKLVGARPYKAVPPLAPTDKAGKIIVYPNPVSGMLTISQLNPADKWEQLEIVSRDGKIVMSQKINNGAAFINAFVNNLKKGLYIILLKDKNGKTASLKFIKN